jgi:hypothetical protein
MKRTTLFIAISSLAISVAAIQGCGDDTDTFPATTTEGAGGDPGTGGSGGAGGGGVVPPPAIGAQIDRSGRPAINTALNNSFNPDTASANAAKDGWNQNDDPATWTTDYAGELAKNLAIIDALDMVCGNQLLAAVVMPPNPIPADRYATLAGALADDRLWVNTASTVCDAYLGVEANVVLAPNEDCGGRTLDYDVVDTSYTLLATGGTAPVTDGVAGLPDEVGGTTFPYLAVPH